MKHFTGLLVGALFCSFVGPLWASGLSTEQRQLHVLNRIAYGPSAVDIARINEVGVDRYIDEQLHPERIPLPQSLARQLDDLFAINKSTGDMIAEFREAEREAKQNPEQGKQERRQLVVQIAEQTATARLSRAIYSPRQLEEVMVDFWFNHFNVFEGKGLDRVLVSAYERDAIRPYVFGRFRDLLGATAKHPAMLFYLDNWLSTAPGFQSPIRINAKQKAGGLNENYARELMELHTLGVDGGYTQKDVTELARILTGWTFDPRDGMFRFVDRRHDQGVKDCLGSHVTSNGQAEGEYALDTLAKAPATARHISFQLAQYFVSDQPSQSLVDRLTRRFTESDGNIREVLDTLLHSPEFLDPVNYAKKFKTPYQYLVSTLRTSDVQVVNYRPLLGTLRQLGMPLYGAQTPDGYKNTEAAWLNPDALSRRINFATALAAGRLPLSSMPDPNGDGRPEQMNSRRTISAPRETQDVQKSFVALDANTLGKTMNGLLSSQTRAAIADADPRLRAALMLGSPDFMRH